MSAPGPTRDELREAAFAGVRWMTVARGAAEALAFGSLVVLAHLVPPAEVGRATIALIVPMLASILTYEACGAALVQRPELDPAHLRCATALALGAGVVLAAVTYVAAPWLVDPLLGAQTTELVRLAAPAFLLGGLAAVPLARLQRALRFRRISVAEVTGVASGAVAACSLAVAGLDGEAIVAGALVSALAMTSVYVASARPVRPVLDRRALGDIAGFGLPSALQALSWVALRNVDYVIIGARLGAAQVGFYFRAFQLAVEYQGKVSKVIVQLAFPVLSRTQDLAHLRSVQERIVRTHAVLTFPFLASLVVLAPVLIPWLLGDAWEPAVLPAQILAVAGMAQVPRVATGQGLLAAGRPGRLLAFNLVVLPLYAATVLLAAPHGLTAVCVAVSGAYVAMLVASYRFLLRPCLGVPVRRLWDHVAPAGAASLVLAAVELPVAELLGGAGSPAPVTIAVAGAAGLAAYAAVLRRAFPVAWGDTAEIASRVTGRTPRRRAPRAPDPLPAAVAEG